jgi:uncharacterized SAM-binding protein YcdF (DUF218 family)
MVGEAPKSSELIVVLAGGARERLLTALDLYRGGFAPAIMITDPYGFPDSQMRELVAAGVPERALLVPPLAATTTVEDARCIREVVLRKGLRSLLVVTSPYHCRRARLAFSRVLSDLEVRVTVTASSSLYVDLDQWWKSRDGWNKVPAEYLKLVRAWMTVPDFGTVGGPGGRKSPEPLDPSEGSRYIPARVPPGSGPISERLGR